MPGWENTQPVPSAGKHVTDAKWGKYASGVICWLTLVFVFSLTDRWKGKVKPYQKNARNVTQGEGRQLAEETAYTEFIHTSQDE